MTTHKITTRKEWLAARLELLEAEKELTRQSDEIARRRQALPWVRIDKEYRFDTDKGSASLADLFRGRSQLLVYHFMFGPDYKAGCPSCSAIADGFDGIAVHLAHHDVMLWAVSRAPLAKLQAYEKRLGWTFPWASSFESDFNFDFSVGFTEDQQRAGLEYNYRREAAATRPAPQERAEREPAKGQRASREPAAREAASRAQATREPAPHHSAAREPLAGKTVGEWDLRGSQDPVAEMAATTGTGTDTYLRERPGMSAFVLEDGVVYHTYSTFARGVDGLWSMYQWLDRAPKGRNETGFWWRRHDEYEKQS